MMQCVTCHTDIKDNAEKGKRTPGHGAAAEEGRLRRLPPGAVGADRQARPDRRAGRAWAWSPRTSRPTGSRSTPAPTRTTRPSPTPPATTATTRTPSTFRPKNTPEHTQWRLSIPAMCGNCHTDQLEAYQDSVHGKENAKKHAGPGGGLLRLPHRARHQQHLRRPVQAAVTRQLRQLPQARARDLQGHLPRQHHDPGLQLHGQVLRLPRQPRDQARGRPASPRCTRTTG